LFATQNRYFLLEERYTTHQQIDNTIFLGLGYEVNARFNFGSQQTQACMQASSAILFRVAFQSLSN